MKTKYIKLIFMFVLVIGIFIIPQCVNAETYTDTSGNVYTYEISNNEATITDFSGGGDIEIPSKFGEYTVTNIDDQAFKECSDLESVIIPDSMTSIGNSAFYWCYGLTSVTIGNGVTSIGARAFENCSGLTSVTIGNGVTSIGAYSFRGCSSLTSITIPEGVTSIGNFALASCKGLTSITIPEGVTSIGGDAFYLCNSLEKIYWNAVSIHDFSSSSYPFKSVGKNTNGLTVIFGEDVERIPAYTFYKCEKLTCVKISDSVTSIGKYSFFYCSGLTSVIISDNVKSIGDYAFKGCIGLTNMTIPDSVTSIGDSAFYDCAGLTSVAIPEGVTSIGEYSFFNCSGLTSVTIGNGVTSIGACAFENCSGLTSVTIGNSVTSIGESAFYGCAGLTSMAIPEGVTSIGNFALASCKGLTSITIPEGVTSIGGDAFYLCNSLEKIYWNAVSIHDFSSSSYPFKSVGKNTNGLTVIFGEDVERIPAYTFYKCEILTCVKISDSVTSIGVNAFYGCSGLEKIYWNAASVASSSAFFQSVGVNTNGLTVIFGEGVERIPANIFYNCKKLTSITIPDSVTNIGKGAFEDCNGLTSVYINDLAKWCNIVFGDCYANPLLYADGIYIKGVLTNDVVIPYGVECINSFAFYGFDALASVTIPDSVTRINSVAFSECDGLTNVSVPDSVEIIGEGAFEGCSSLEEITLPFIGLERGNTGAKDAVFGYIFGSGDTTEKYYLTASSYIPESLKKVTITDETMVGYGAFYGCSNISDIVIKGNVRGISSHAFAYHNNFLNITIESEDVRFADSMVFYNTDFATLYGYSDSTVEQYADSHGIDFEPLVSVGDCEISGAIKSLNDTLVVNVDLSKTVSGQVLNVVLYDKDDILIDYIIVPSNTPYNNMNVVFKDNPNAKYAKIFLWDELTQVVPLADAKKVDIVR